MIDIQNQPFQQFTKNSLDEIVPLAVHIIERAADEDADGLPGSGHG